MKNTGRPDFIKIKNIYFNKKHQKSEKKRKVNSGWYTFGNPYIFMKGRK